jgi:hypothetical protein
LLYRFLNMICFRRPSLDIKLLTCLLFIYKSYILRISLNFSSKIIFANFNIPAHINFPGSLLSSEVKGQPLDGRILKQTNIKQSRYRPGVARIVRGS